MILLNSFIGICSFRRAANNFVCTMLYLIDIRQVGIITHEIPLH